MVPVLSASEHHSSDVSVNNGAIWNRTEIGTFALPPSLKGGTSPDLWPASSVLLSDSFVLGVLWKFLGKFRESRNRWKVAVGQCRRNQNMEEFANFCSCCSLCYSVAG